MSDFSIFLVLITYCFWSLRAEFGCATDDDDDNEDDDDALHISSFCPTSTIPSQRTKNFTPDDGRGAVRHRRRLYRQPGATEQRQPCHGQDCKVSTDSESPIAPEAVRQEGERGRHPCSTLFTPTESRASASALGRRDRRCTFAEILPIHHFGRCRDQTDGPVTGVGDRCAKVLRLLAQGAAGGR